MPVGRTLSPRTQTALQTGRRNFLTKRGLWGSDGHSSASREEGFTGTGPKEKMLHPLQQSVVTQHLMQHLSPRFASSICPSKRTAPPSVNPPRRGPKRLKIGKFRASDRHSHEPGPNPPFVPAVGRHKTCTLRKLKREQMRFGIPLLHDRVAPRSTCAEGMVVLVLDHGRVTVRETIRQPIHDRVELVSLVREHRIDTLICGANSTGTRESLLESELTLVENVAGSIPEVVDAVERGTLRSGYGLLTRPHSSKLPPAPKTAASTHDESPQTAVEFDEPPAEDCLACSEPVCLNGGRCVRPSGEILPASPEIIRMLEAAADITFESERELCRMAELIYFVIEMGFRRVGVAFCIDLIEPTRILCGVLRRFVDVFAACCKLPNSSANTGNIEEPGFEPIGWRDLPCNPLGQASVLKQFGSEFNVLVGLCMGADSVFVRASAAPVTTLFVKDRMLANNPIGAVYSEYYLKEISKT
jgi:uncharacterized metal-binding protein/predicted Fe-Mo cluster-binding NifX family protein